VDIKNKIVYRSQYVCNSIKAFDFSTLYTTIPHALPTSNIKELIMRCKRSNQNLYINEGETTQLSKDKDRRTNNYLQNMHIKLKIE